MTRYKNVDLGDVINHFQVEGRCMGISPFGSGLVHESFETVCKKEDHFKRYLLQKINTYVFHEPLKVMENIDIVLKHVAEKMSQEKREEEEDERTLLKLVPTVDHKTYFLDEAGHYWRIYHFIEHTVVFNLVEKAEQAYEAARMFGQFSRYLSDLDPTIIHTTIPRFHSIAWRLEQFDEAIRQDKAGRVGSTAKEIDFVNNHRQLAEPICPLIHQGVIPRRVAHHDTKINNVLMDKVTHRGLCVIDLDTIMPGTILSDFGDMVRTFTPSVSEEEADLSKLFFRLPIFKALVQGFLSEANRFITPVEKENLVNAGLWITYMQAIRFLTDYLNGDIYYKTTYPGQNLNRAANQITLVSHLMDNRHTMQEIVSRY
jgi:hypothetical protein